MNTDKREAGVMKIGMIVERRYLRQAITQAVVRSFSEQNAQVDVLCTEDCFFDPTTGLVRDDSGAEFNLAATTS